MTIPIWCALDFAIQGGSIPIIISVTALAADTRGEDIQDTWPNTKSNHQEKETKEEKKTKKKMGQSHQVPWPWEKWDEAFLDMDICEDAKSTKRFLFTRSRNDWLVMLCQNAFPNLPSPIMCIDCRKKAETTSSQVCSLPNQPSQRQYFQDEHEPFY